MRTINAAKKQLINYGTDNFYQRLVFLVIKLDILVENDPNNEKDLLKVIESQNDSQIQVKYCICY